MALDAVIVGGGLFGQIVAAALRDQGREVLIIDARKPEAGSAPAACIMKPSWYESMGKEIYTPGLTLLDKLYGLQSVMFQIWSKKTLHKVRKEKVHWIPPHLILEHFAMNEIVTKVEPGWVGTRSGHCIEAPLIIVAAGIWTEKLLPQYKQQGQKGVAFLWPSTIVKTPFIYNYAPYKQFLLFNRGDGAWAGDGTAIKQENWTEKRENDAYDRVTKYTELASNRLYRKLIGVRPYSKEHKPCIIEEVTPGIWVASGGAKNGTVAAGYAAHVILEATS